MEKELTDQQLLFCKEYIKDLNAKQAAIRAGYSEKTAASQASRLLTNVNVQQVIQKCANERASRVQVDADTILKELLKLATVDITEAYDEAGWLKNLKDMPEDVRRAISSIDVSEMFAGEDDQKSIIGVNKKVKFYDKTKSLELLGKHLKMFTEKVEHSAPEGIKVIIEDYPSKKPKSET